MPPSSHPLSSCWSQLLALYSLGENWNGYEVLAPNEGAIEEAKLWLLSFYEEVSGNEMPWINPHVAANEAGDVALEWTRGIKRLNVFISPQEAWYIKAWGPSVLHEMSDGSISIRENRLAIWSWFMNE
ncbi:MAG: hypothetical protein M3Y56_10820 [Armatimonadota bacterium]|nr:hypothetical protein [Armatimonadota bacterium]